MSKGTVQRWVVTAHARAAVTQNCRDMAGLCEDPTWTHKQASKPRMDRDETDVQRVLTVFRNWVNPFHPSDEVSNLSSSEELSSDLLDAYAKGETKMDVFITERIQTNHVDFYAPLTQLKLKTFTSEIRSKGVKVSGREMQLKADRNLFARLLVIAQSRSLNLRDVLKHELGPYPWSLSSVDGSLAKTVKSTMMSLLEK